MADSYQKWLDDVQAALRSINMPFDDWQQRWTFDFQKEFNSGTTADDAAIKANRYWWYQQNKSLKQHCRIAPRCWLPRGHEGACQVISPDATVPTYAAGDYVKVEFPDKATGVAEWMWVRVTGCDEQKRLVFGTLDNEPLNDYGGKIELGSELAISFAQIRDHRKPTEFKEQ